MGIKKRNRISRNLYINPKGIVISSVNHGKKQTNKFVKLLNDGKWDELTKRDNNNHE